MEQLFVLVAGGGMIAWMLYMYTFRTQDMIQINKQHQEHMGRVFNGAAKVALFGFKVWRR